MIIKGSSMEFSKIKTHYVKEDIKKEKELEKRREEIAKLVAD